MRHTIEIATNSGGNIFRAYDKASGNTLWEVELEAGASGPPVSYLYEGKQYIVVAIGDREHSPGYCQIEATLHNIVWSGWV